MYLAFTEEQAITIRKTGLSVAQYKLCVKKGVPPVVYALRTACKKIEEAFDMTYSRAQELIDDVKFFIEEVFDNLNLETSTRYKLVKFYSKCRKVDRFQFWKRTRVVTRLARSNC